MDFRDSPEEAAFRAEARAWLEANAAPRGGGQDGGLFAERADEAAYLARSREWQAKKYDAGWAGITWPKEYGGRGGTPIQQIIWNQEAANFDAPEAVFGIGIGMGGPTIMTHGSPEMKARLLPRLLRGDDIWCQLFSEPSAGSDVAASATRAVRDGDEWVVNGQKVWTSGAHYSQWGMLLARTDPDVPKHKGLTYFMLNMSTPGVEVRPLKQMTGGANFNEVFFTDVRIPDSDRVDAVGNGWRVALTTLMNERVSIGTGGSGGGVDVHRLIALARKRMLHGRPAIEDPVIRQELMQLYLWSEGLRFTGYRVVTAISRGQIPGPEGSIGKLSAARLGTRAADLALAIMSGDGMLSGDDTESHGLWQLSLLGNPAMRIAGGSDEIQRNIIGERVLGLPGEPRVDKDVPFRDLVSG
jgi:alkylation response protein AidB-like acyl-CoA dehydrogenase